MAQFAVGCEGVRRLRGQHALSSSDRIPDVIPVTGLAWVASLAPSIHISYLLAMFNSLMNLLGRPARTTASVRTVPPAPSRPPGDALGRTASNQSAHLAGCPEMKGNIALTMFPFSSRD